MNHSEVKEGKPLKKEMPTKEKSVEIFFCGKMRKATFAGKLDYNNQPEFDFITLNDGTLDIYRFDCPLEEDISSVY